MKTKQRAKASQKHSRKRLGAVIQTVIVDYFKRISPCVPTTGLVEIIKKPQNAYPQENAQERKQKQQDLRKCGQKRWSALLHRIGKSHGMKATLGLVRWEAFVQDARDSYYETFLKRFTRTDKRIACAGRLTGTRKSCPVKFSLDIHGKNQRI